MRRRTCLIGHTGFVGTNLLRQRSFSDCYNSRNIEQIRGRAYKEVVCAGVPGTKWIANARPEEDLRTIDRLVENLVEVRADRFVLVSTIDVYKDASGVRNEDHLPLEGPEHAYGLHRRDLEQRLTQIFPELLIVRLPALFGCGLKKNPLYDLMHAHHLSAMNVDSTYQWYCLKNLSEHLDLAKKNNLKLLNLFPEPLSLREVVENFFGEQYVMNERGAIFSSKSPESLDIVSSAKNLASYNLQTKWSALFSQNSGYIYSKQEVLGQLGAFLRSERSG